jgi:septal ring factor EnvC (AmiA/AmiB activator)
LDRKLKCSSKIYGVILFLCSIVLAVSAQKSNPDIGQYDHEINQKAGVLDSIKEELKKGRQKLVELQTQEGSVQERIDQVEKNIVSSKTYLTLLSRKIDSLEVQITVLKDSATVAGKRLLERQKIMEHRLRQAYMSGNPNLVMLLLSSENPTDFINKTRYIQELKRYDSELLARINNARIDFDTRKSSYQDERVRLDALVGTKKQEHVVLLKEEDQRKAMLDEVRTKKKSYEIIVAELERSQRELNEIIKIIEIKRKKAKQQVDTKKVLSFEKKKGKLPWPVDGTVVVKYGKLVHPVYKTVTLNNGIDIHPKSSGVVMSVAPGTIIHTGSMRGLGKLVIVDHSGGYITVYAHLNQIDVKDDQEIENGTVIGRVNSGGADSSLHFEIRKSSNALDPNDWLE